MRNEEEGAKQRRRAGLAAIVREAAEARVLRAVLSRRQLQEVMVDFWFNHFNVFAGKGLDHLWIGDYEERAIRPFVLGRFGDLLLAATKHPAMLVYLDNTLSTAPGSPGARGADPRQCAASTRISRARSWSCTPLASMAAIPRTT